jgi:hypothetical protein
MTFMEILLVAALPLDKPQHYSFSSRVGGYSRSRTSIPVFPSEGGRIALFRASTDVSFLGRAGANEATPAS